MASDHLAPMARLERIEGWMRRARVGIIASALAAGALLVGGFVRPLPPVVRAERFELLSRQGIRQAILAMDSTGFTVMLLDARGEPAGFLRLSDEPRLALETERGREVAGLGAPRPRNLTE
jgi:hypothetical protein